MATEDIYNYRKVDDHVLTGGQPTEEQLQSAAQDGVTTVINLVPFDPERQLALPNEGGIVQALGMAYHYIPVDWANPTEQDFTAFESAMNAHLEGRTLIHCAANYRVTAFYSLYAMKHMGWSTEQAETFRASIWEGSDYPVWEEFIRQMRQKITG